MVTANKSWEAVIGLEVHAQLLTRSKMFCSCPTTFGSGANENTCPVCEGLPGALPVLNRRALEFGIRAALAMNCTIAPRSIFARKNYFYPDLPKGYQISQYELPLATEGSLEIRVNGATKRVGLVRIHMEEDAGKSIHDDAVAGRDSSLVDLNRSGVPLLEIVSQSDLRSPAEASAYLKEIRLILTFLEICDGNMEEGSLRCDANVSVRRAGEAKLGVRAEVKNMNSFR
ncbi:MAG: Asp-tRNA(Asn)/Glu-tRNA(Gln) amidotransferase subunit GatB, partial [Vicinamibacteria bacterium]